MTNDLVHVPAPSGESSSFLRLSKSPQGRLFRKQILPMNKGFIHPADHGSKIFIDDKFAQTLVDNFHKGYAIVQVPIVDSANHHTESPLANIGEVVDLDYDDTGVYATIDARKHADDLGKTLLGASAFMHLNYTDTETGNHVGPALLHLAITNRPHVQHLGDYEEVIKASADIEDSEKHILFMCAEGESSEAEGAEEEVPAQDTPEENPPVEPKVEEVPSTETDNLEDGLMTPEEMIAALKEHGIDVEALQSDAARAAELSGQLEAATEQLQLSASDGEAVSVIDLAEAVVELSNSRNELTDQVASLLESNRKFAVNAATAEVDGLIRTGRVLPKQRDVMIKLSMDDRETFDALVPDTAIVRLSEEGVTVHENPDDTAALAEHVDRYKTMATARSGRAKARS